MKKNTVNVTGLSEKQIAVIEEIIEAFKALAQQEETAKEITDVSGKMPDDNLEKLHQEFSWLVADLGVKKPLTRSQIYDI